MVKNTSKVTARTPRAKAAGSTKKASTVKAKSASAKTTRSTKATKSNKVDYYPNRMTFYISVAAVAILFLLALLVTINIYG